MKINLNSLAFRLVLNITIGFVVIAGSFFMILNYQIRHQVNAGVESTTESVIAVLQAAILETPQLFGSSTLERMVTRFTNAVPGIHRVEIVDRTLKVVTESGEPLSDHDVNTALNLSITNGEKIKEYFSSNGKDYFHIIEPLYGQYDPQSQSPIIGAIMIDMHLTNANREIDRALSRSIMLSTATIIAFMIIQLVTIQDTILKPLRGLHTVVQRFGQGDLTARVKILSNNEIGQAAQSFNHMADEIENIQGVLHTEIGRRKNADAAVEQAYQKLTAYLLKLEMRTNEIRLMSEMSSTLQTCLTLEEAAGVTKRFVSQLFPSTSGALYIYKESRNYLERLTAWGAQFSADKEATFTPEECWALRRGQLHHFQSNTSDLLCPHIKCVESVDDSLCVPLMAQGEALGVLHFCQALQADIRDANQNSDPEANKQLASAIADQLALAISNFKMRITLRMQSIRDPLTGLYNRHYLEESLAREAARAERSGAPLGIVMLDIDHFKHFNDTFGHDAGDVVLRALGEFLLKHVRGGDIACRFGGEEFTLILPGASLKISIRRAEELRKGVKLFHLQHDGQDLGEIRLSLGVAVFPDHGETPQAVVEAADAALYRAKQNGRDRVEVFRKERPKKK